MSRQSPPSVFNDWLHNATCLDKAGPLLEMPLQLSDYMRAHTDTPKDIPQFTVEYFEDAICQLDAQVPSDSGDVIALWGSAPEDFRRVIVSSTDESEDFFLWISMCTRDYRTWAAALIRLQRYQQAAASLRAIAQLYASSVDGGMLPSDPREMSDFLSTVVPHPAGDHSSTVDTTLLHFSNLVGAPNYQHQLIVEGAVEAAAAFQAIETSIWRRIARVWNWVCTDAKQMIAMEKAGLFTSFKNTLQFGGVMLGRVSYASSEERVTHAWVDVVYKPCGLVRQ